MATEPAEKKTKGQMVFGYWNIRGVSSKITIKAAAKHLISLPSPLIQLAQPIRLLFKYVGADFEDVRYTAEGRKWIL